MIDATGVWLLVSQVLEPKTEQQGPAAVVVDHGSDPHQEQPEQPQ